MTTTKIKTISIYLLCVLFALGNVCCFIDGKKVPKRGVVNEIKSIKELNEAVETQLPILLEFYSPNCAVCRRFEEHMDSASGKLKNILFLKMNALEISNGLAFQFDIYYYPKILLIISTSEIYEFEGSTKRLDEFVPFLKENGKIYSDKLVSVWGPFSYIGKLKFRYGTTIEWILLTFGDVLNEKAGENSSLQVVLAFLCLTIVAFLLIAFVFFVSYFIK